VAVEDRQDEDVALAAPAHEEGVESRAIGTSIFRAQTAAPPYQSTQRSPPPTYAALDLGTNNCRLLIARPAQHGFRVVDAFSRIVRLGEGLAASGKLAEPAMDRAVEALKICRGKMASRGVTRARLVTTEACRPRPMGSTSSAASLPRPTSNWRSSTSARKPRSPSPAAPLSRTRPPKASSSSISVAVRPRSSGWAGATKRAIPPPASANGPRCRSAS
jgi:hypothetical protein